jgi:hypothetical protein
MSRSKTLYREYRSGTLTLRPDFLPILRHCAQGGGPFEAEACEVLAAGVIERDGEQVEYQDLRVYLKSPHAPPETKPAPRRRPSGR